MIKAMFTINEIKAEMQKSVKAIEAAILAMLRVRGEQFVSEARQESTYTDRTGNLRSSLGYFIYYGKTAIEKNVAGSSEGQAEANKVVSEVSKRDGVYYLIGVAGMNYASHVEARGYNVISNQSIKIVPLIEGDINKLKSKIEA